MCRYSIKHVYSPDFHRSMECQPMTSSLCGTTLWPIAMGRNEYCIPFPCIDIFQGCIVDYGQHLLYTSIPDSAVYLICTLSYRGNRWNTQLSVTSCFLSEMSWYLNLEYAARAQNLREVTKVLNCWLWNTYTVKEKHRMIMMIVSN